MLKYRVMELREFLRTATKAERAALAAVCHDSVSYLYQLAGRHRYASALLAVRIEKETQRLAGGSRGRLRPVPRETLVRYPEIFEDR